MSRLKIYKIGVKPILNMKKCIVCLVLLFALCVSAVSAIVPYDTYTYSGDGTVLETAHAYIPGEIIGSETVPGMCTLNNPDDLFVDSRNYLYIVDKGNNRIVVLDDQNRFIKSVDSYDDDGKKCTFSEPSGIYVTDDGDMYIADTANGKVVAISEEGQTLKILRQPETDSWDNDYPFRPIAVAVDSYGKSYVVAMNVTLGVIVYDTHGEFETFLGAQKVTYDILDYLWRSFMTEEQLARMTQFVPTEYTSIDVDENGFVYAVSTGYSPTEIDEAIKSGTTDGRVTPIRKLNPGGYDILLRTGYFAPFGDLAYPMSDTGEPMVSSIIDVALGPAETYTMLDSRFGRLFTYSQRGDLLFAFGGKSAQDGNSQNPVAVEYRKNDILVLDSLGGQITVYTRTEYADLLIEALEMYDSFDYEGAAVVWEQIIESNPNLDIAYDNVGQALLRQKEYDAAMRNFKESDNQTLYSEAWAGKRSKLIRTWFIPLFITAVVLLIGFAWLVKKINRINAQDCKGKSRFFHHFVYAFYVIVHPFKGFWDIKHEKRGSAAVATMFYGLAFLSDLFLMVCTAFIFNTSTSSGSSLLNIAFQTTGASLIFVLANWCLTSLMDGEGTLKDIYTNVGYALVPLILFNIISVPLSYALVQGEGMYLTTLQSIGMIWTLLLIFSGVLVAQQYGFFKNIVTCLFSIIGMAIIIFVALLCITMYNQIFQFISVIFFELFKR